MVRELTILQPYLLPTEAVHRLLRSRRILQERPRVARQAALPLVLVLQLQVTIGLQQPGILPLQPQVEGQGEVQLLAVL